VFCHSNGQLVHTLTILFHMLSTSCQALNSHFQLWVPLLLVVLSLWPLNFTEVQCHSCHMLYCQVPGPPRGTAEWRGQGGDLGALSLQHYYFAFLPLSQDLSLSESPFWKTRVQEYSAVLCGRQKPCKFCVSAAYVRAVWRLGLGFGWLHRDIIK
jgi:hypothetical protein